MSAEKKTPGDVCNVPGATTNINTNQIQSSTPHAAVQPDYCLKLYAGGTVVLANDSGGQCLTEESSPEMLYEALVLVGQGRVQVVK